MFGSISIVTVSYGTSTFTSASLASLALVSTSSISFSTHFGEKFTLLFYWVWSLFRVVASILFHSCCKLGSSSEFFISVEVNDSAVLYCCCWYRGVANFLLDVYSRSQYLDNVVVNFIIFSISALTVFSCCWLCYIFFNCLLLESNSYYQRQMFSLYHGALNLYWSIRCYLWGNICAAALFVVSSQCLISNKVAGKILLCILYYLNIYWW